MNNGCICCTVRGDLIRILTALSRRAAALDAIIIETTGCGAPPPAVPPRFYACNRGEERGAAWTPYDRG